MALQVEAGQGGLVLVEAGADLPGQVESGKARVAVLQVLHRAHALDVVVEPAVAFHQLVQGGLAGVAEGAVADVVSQGDALGQVLVGPQRACDGAPDRGHLKGVGQPGAVVVGRAVDEDLGLVLQAAETLAVDHAVAVALEVGAVLVRGLAVAPAAAVRAAHGVRGEHGRLLILEFFSRQQHGAYSTVPLR